MRVGNGPIPALVLSPPLDGAAVEGGLGAAPIGDFQRRLAAELATGQQLTLWLDGSTWQDVRQVSSWAWNVTRRVAPEPHPSSSTAEAAGVRLLFVPHLSALRVQDGVKLVASHQSVGLSASGTLSVSVFDLTLRRLVAVVDLSEHIFYGGDAADAPVLALRLLLYGLIHGAVADLRKHALIALAPRIEGIDAERGTLFVGKADGLASGDAFHFLDAQGERSGYVTLRDVAMNRASFRIDDQGIGDRLIEAERYIARRSLWLLESTWRLAYQQPDAPALARARERGQEVSHLGRAVEIGVRNRMLYAFSPTSPVGIVRERGAAWALGDLTAFNFDARLGIRWESTHWAGCGCVLSPLLRAGGLLQLSKVAFVGVQASPGIQLEVHRGSGDASLIIDLTAQWVRPLAITGAFLDNAAPSFHGFTVGVGLLPRPSRYERPAPIMVPERLQTMKLLRPTPRSESYERWLRQVR